MPGPSGFLRSDPVPSGWPHRGQGRAAPPPVTPMRSDAVGPTDEVAVLPPVSGGCR